MILVIVLIILIFSALVIAHEWGHFMVARRNGVKVEEFGVGFPPKLFSRVKGGTEYSINLFPIGGFVRMKGEDGESKAKDSFSSKSYKSKAKIVMAGVGMNFLIAYVIVVILLIFGIPAILPSGFVKIGPIKPSKVETSPLQIMAVNKGSAAEKAGITIGSEIIKFNNVEVKTTEDLQRLTKDNAGKEVSIEIQKNGKASTVNATLAKDNAKGYLGTVAQPIEIAYYNPFIALIAAFVYVVQLAIATVAAFGGFIGGLVTKAKVSENVAGPVGIVSIFGSVVKFGWRYVLAFVASISLSLAVINSLPIPALDGGRLMLMTLTKLGIKITPEREAKIHWIGFILLIILVVIVTVSDIIRLKP
jgi:regulator of sigma E protease